MTRKRFVKLMRSLGFRLSGINRRVSMIQRSNGRYTYEDVWNTVE